MNINQHYGLLLGLGEEWEVTDVALDLNRNRVDIYVGYTKSSAVCPVCGKSVGVHDMLGERVWRHLDTMQFETRIHARTPRSDCPEHGVKVIGLPWASKSSRFTLMFEAFAIEVIRSARNVKDAQKILRLNWNQVHEIMRRAVGRGLARRPENEVAYVGMDEKSFLSGKAAGSFVSVVTDLDRSRVIDVERGRCEKTASALVRKAFTPWQREMVCGVAIDMSAPFGNAIRKLFPNADVVYDRFHIKRYLCEAVDCVRKKEHARLLKADDRRLSRTKFMWLKNFESLSAEARAHMKGLIAQSLEVGRAWGLKEAFERFWDRRDRSYAETYFRHWFDAVIKSGLRPMQKVARTLGKHLDGLLNWYGSMITNAASEGFNSKIQSLKANARGFRNFENYRITILFFCGKLDMRPEGL